MAAQSHNLDPRTPLRPLVWPETVQVLHDAVSKVADPNEVYLVGGAVRDALLGKAEFGLHDLDLTTGGDALRLAREVAGRLGGAFFPLDRERDVGRVVVEGATDRRMIDVARFRGEGLEDDLTDRDFTVNAMAVPVAALDRLIDPLGGESDLLQHKLLKMCSPDAIVNDPIRALRAVRFGLQLGLRLDKATLTAARDGGKRLTNADGKLAQPERARDELFTLLGGNNPAGAARLLDRLGLLHAFSTLNVARIDTLEHLAGLLLIISPARSDNSAANLSYGIAVMTLDRHRAPLQEHLAVHFADDRPLKGLLGLWVLMEEETGDETARRLRLSNAERDRLAAISRGVARFDQLRPPIDPRAVHRYYRGIGEAGIDATLIALAAQLAAGQRAQSLDSKAWGSLLDDVASPLLDGFFRRHQDYVQPPPLVRGDDLMAELGLQAGPQIGQLLEQLLEEQAAGELTSREEALDYVRNSATDPPQ